MKGRASRIVVIGGGMAGLGCGLRLGRPVILFEREKELGGLGGCYRVGGSAVERYYHHFFPGDSELFALIEELGLNDRLLWLRSSVGYRVGGKNYRLNTPLEVLRFPALGFRQKLALGSVVRRARGIEVLSDYDSVPAVDWVLETAGPSVYDGFFRPLLNLKWGERAREISAAWLINRMKIRSNRTVRGERLAYVRGGWAEVLGAMGGRIESRGGEIRQGAAVRRIVTEGRSVTGVETDRGFEPADVVVATLPVPQIASMLDGDPGFASPSYQGTTCLLLGLRRQLLDGIYWLNIEEGLPFGAVIEHTNFVPASEYGCHLVYLVAYHNRVGALTQRERPALPGDHGHSPASRESGAAPQDPTHSGAFGQGADVPEGGGHSSGPGRSATVPDGGRRSPVRGGSVADAHGAEEQSDGEVVERFVEALAEVVPSLTPSDILFHHMARTVYSSPHYVTGYAGRHVIPYRTGIRGLYIAGMASRPSYPERSLCASLRAGYECAEAVVEDLGTGGEASGERGTRARAEGGLGEECASLRTGRRSPEQTE